MLLYTAIGVGLLGSFHCLGMCAPITWAVPGNNRKKWQWLGGRMVYNTGRLITYALLGVLAGLLGTTIYGMEVPDKALLKPLSRFILWVKMRIGKLLIKKGLVAQLTLGMLNGLLPCGLVYAALIAAVSMGSVEGAALYMLVFGLGTFPMMLAAAFFGKMLSQKFKQRVWNLAPKMVAVVGILFILRGMNLGIPYVSPMLVSKAGITTCMGNTEAIEFVDIVED